MHTTVETALQAPSAVIRREIERFLITTRKRSEDDGERRRRSRRRHHRSWPLLVSLNGKPFAPELSAALHNACEHGISFLSPQAVPVGARVYLKLFSYDDFCPRVPALVRHATANGHGFLIGCEFDVTDEAVCAHALELGRRTRPCRVDD